MGRPLITLRKIARTRAAEALAAVVGDVVNEALPVAAEVVTATPKKKTARKKAKRKTAKRKATPLA